MLLASLSFPLLCNVNNFQSVYLALCHELVNSVVFVEGRADGCEK